jgi:hypothetical protein
VRIVTTLTEAFIAAAVFGDGRHVVPLVASFTEICAVTNEEVLVLGPVRFVTALAETRRERAVNDLIRKIFTVVAGPAEILALGLELVRVPGRVALFAFLVPVRLVHRSIEIDGYRWFGLWGFALFGILEHPLGFLRI